MADEKAKKLTAEVSLARESEQFDLAGFGPAGVDHLCSAFTKPFPLGSMIRLSFLVGGGKKVRQKYNDGLPNLLADALRGVSFVEDRGASTSLDSAGTFKYQHDTDKDGVITRAELGALQSNATVAAWFDRYDNDGVGRVSVRDMA